MSERVAGVDINDVLSWIDSFRTSEGYPPSRREIAERFEIGLETTQRILHALVEQGLLVVKPAGARSINITGAGMKIITEDFG